MGVSLQVIIDEFHFMSHKTIIRIHDTAKPSSSQLDPSKSVINPCGASSRLNVTERANIIQQGATGEATNR
jgi:hypothetical protein